MDSNMRLRVGATAGNLVEGESYDFPLAPMSKPLYLHVNVPEYDDSLSVSAAYKNAGGDPLAATVLDISTEGHHWVPLFHDDESLAQLTVTMTVDGDFGAVDVWISNSPVW